MTIGKGIAPMKKNTKGRKDQDSLVYTTHPETMGSLFSGLFEEETSHPDLNLRVRVIIEKKHRGGKTATIIKGLETLAEEELNGMAKSLKQTCGVGGSAKDGEIILQGDQVEKAIDFLIRQGYKDTKKGGG